MEVKALRDLSAKGQDEVARFVDAQTDGALPYHLPAFARVVDAVFGYENLSLVALDQSEVIVGYLPQWRHGKIIESVPWRDKGGPLAVTPAALDALVAHTIDLVKKLGLRGFIWKDYQTDLLKNNAYFFNVEIDLSTLTRERYWRCLSNKVRGKVRSARKSGLCIKSKWNDTQIALREFYRLFMDNRKRLGVPAYPFRLFSDYGRHMRPEWMKIYNVYHQDSAIASLILFRNRHVAIDAYSASNRTGLDMKANDFLLFEVISDCIDEGIRRFDFGADSPLQESLINYKCKWLGHKRLIQSSFFGHVTEKDHNLPRYNPMKWVFRRLPAPFYDRLSMLVVR